MQILQNSKVNKVLTFHLQKRYLKRILQDKQRKFVADIHEPLTVKYSRIPPQNPLTSPQITANNPVKSNMYKREKFFVTNKVPLPPTFPFSNGRECTPQLNWDVKSERVGLIGKKVGMTNLWDQWGKLRPVTVIQVLDNEVLHCRYEPKIGSWLLKVGGFNEANIPKMEKSVLNVYRKYLIQPKEKLMEFEVSENALLPSGFKLNVAHFVPGQYVDVQGITKGKGFQGTMKRHGFGGQPASHGVSLTHRSGGSIGASTSPGRVMKGRKMAGRMGGELRSCQSLEVLKIQPKENLIFVAGPIPGSNGGFLKLRDAVKKLQIQKCFPKEINPNSIPFPSFFGDVEKLPLEILPKFKENKDDLLLDPLLKVVGELE
ncbi:54S ribosomal protein L3 [Lobulomyces angularis]|nr:54S ribosomal protein L3 [Lobulomyces angularis]